MAFGTRRVDASEHQNGLMLTIAAESALKLVAFLAVGAFVVWGMFDGLSDLFHRAVAVPRIRAVLAAPPDFTVWTTLILLSSGAMLFLPRQFHVAVVENRAESDIQSASVTFPLYLLAINFFVVPLSIAGLVLFPEALDRDVGVMALPIIAENGVMSLIAMLGGLSAATAMVVVEIDRPVDHGFQQSGDPAAAAPRPVASGPGARRRFRRLLRRRPDFRP